MKTIITLLAVVLLACRAHSAVGDLDPAFDPNVGGSSAVVYCTAVQTDGKIIIGGDFSTVGGVVRNNLARVNPDGTLDTSFYSDLPQGADSAVQCVAVMGDGTIIAAGRFMTVGGLPRLHLARFNSDGSADGTFSCDVPGTIYSLVVQPDEKIVLAGAFASAGGVVRKNLARLNTDGTVDPNFVPDSRIFSSSIYCAALQSDGKIVIGGSLRVQSLPSRFGIARLNANGTIDSSFTASTDLSGVVNCVVVGAWGGIVMAGSFSSVNNTSSSSLAVLQTNGALEPFSTSFSPFSPVTATVLSADGYLILGGSSVVSFLQRGISVYMGGNVEGLSMQGDGKVIGAGHFASVAGISRNNIARLLNPGPGSIQDVLRVENTSRIKWLRNGSVPEAQSVTFDVSIDGGNNWTPLGVGNRFQPGALSNTGWFLEGLRIPLGSGIVRGRARIVGGNYNRSSGLVETVAAYSDLLEPYETWKLKYFGDANAPDLESPIAGIAPLVIYGLSGTPHPASRAPVPQRFQYPDGERLRLLLFRDPDRYDVTVTVQAADILGGPWIDLATSTLGSPYTGPGYVGGDSPVNFQHYVEIRDIVNFSERSRRFMRIKVTH